MTPMLRIPVQMSRAAKAAAEKTKEVTQPVREFGQTFKEELKTGAEQITEPTKAAVANIPKILTNLGVSGLKYNPFVQAGNAVQQAITGKDQLAEDISGIKGAGAKIKKELQEGFGIDPESFGTKGGEFISEVAAAMMLGPKIEIGKLPILKSSMQKAPTLFKILKGAFEGAEAAVKFDIVEKGEVLPEDIALGVGVGVAIPGLPAAKRGLQEAITKTPVPFKESKGLQKVIEEGLLFSNEALVKLKGEEGHQ